VMEVLPELQRPGTALDSIYVNSPSTGEAVPLSTFVKWTREPTNFLSINHQSMDPSVTQNCAARLRPSMPRWSKKKTPAMKTEAKNRVFSVARSSFRDGWHGSGLAGVARAPEMPPER
jgi:hypothetical protein